jgi:hypothetical protein
VGGGSVCHHVKALCFGVLLIEQRRIMLAFFCKTKIVQMFGHFSIARWESRPNPSQYSFANTQLTGASRSLESVSVVCV